MRPTIFFAIFGILSAGALADDAVAPPSNPEMPKEIQAQEQLVLLSAKVKNLAEVQDLMLKQQQLILEHLQALRKRVDRLDQDRTNLATHGEAEAQHPKPEPAEPPGQPEGQTNTQSKPLGDASTRLVSGKPLATNQPVAIRLEPYRVQPGDTLSRILLRWNDALEKRGLPKISQEQIERANAGLSPDRIRAGQSLLLPMPEAEAK
jgi:hypothetical protein